MGFTRDVGHETAHLSHDVVMETEEEGGHNSSPPPMPQPRANVAALTMQALSRQSPATLNLDGVDLCSTKQTSFLRNAWTTTLEKGRSGIFTASTTKGDRWSALCGRWSTD